MQNYLLLQSHLAVPLKRMQDKAAVDNSLPLQCDKLQVVTAKAVCVSHCTLEVIKRAGPITAKAAPQR